MAMREMNHMDKTWELVKRLNRREHLLLAKRLLDSVVDPGADADAETGDEESAWQLMSLSAFEAEWDNPEDAIYDDWRAHYGVSEG